MEVTLCHSPGRTWSDRRDSEGAVGTHGPSGPGRESPPRHRIPVISVGSHEWVLFWGTPIGLRVQHPAHRLLDAGRGEERLSRDTVEFLKGLTEGPGRDGLRDPHSAPTAPEPRAGPQDGCRLAPGYCPGHRSPVAHRALQDPRGYGRSENRDQRQIPRRRATCPESMLIPALSRAMASGSTGSSIDLSEFMN